MTLRVFAVCRGPTRRGSSSVWRRARLLDSSKPIVGASAGSVPEGGKAEPGEKHRHGRGRKDTQCRRAVADGDVLLGSICTLGDHAPDEFHGVKTGGTSRSRMSPPGAGSRCASLGEARRGEARSARWYSVEIWVQFLLSDAISSVSIVVVVSTGEAERRRPGRDHPMPACPCPRPPSKTRV